MLQDNKNQETLNENEVDLGAFYHLLNKIFRSIFAFFLTFFTFIASLFLGFLLLIKRNLIWLIIGALVGFFFGLYKFYNNGPTYYSEMVVSPNFESTRLLYQKIDYFNALIRENKTNDLINIFNLTKEDAGKLIYFEIEPLDAPLQKLKLYRNFFVNNKRNLSPGSDSILIKTIKYEDFVSKLTKYDYPLQVIKLKSKSETIYPNVQAGIIKVVHDNNSMSYAKEASQDMMNSEENILTSSLNGIDSLRKAYNVNIENSGDFARKNGQNVLLTQGTIQAQAPEIELYDKELLLKDELMNIKEKKLENHDIIQVYSDFNKVGTRIPKYKEDFIIYAEIGFLVAFIIILLISFYRYLNLIEKRKFKLKEEVL